PFTTRGAPSSPAGLRGFDHVTPHQVVEVELGATELEHRAAQELVQAELLVAKSGDEVANPRQLFELCVDGPHETIERLARSPRNVDAEELERLGPLEAAGFALQFGELHAELVDHALELEALGAFGRRRRPASRWSSPLELQ